jgi:hypothetical protein
MYKEKLSAECEGREWDPSTFVDTKPAAAKSVTSSSTTSISGGPGAPSSMPGYPDKQVNEDYFAVTFASAINMFSCSLAQGPRKFYEKRRFATVPRYT